MGRAWERKKGREREERREREGRGEGKSGQGGRSPDGHRRLAGAGAGHRTRWPEKRHGVQTVWAVPGFGQRRKWGLRGRAHGATAPENFLETWAYRASLFWAGVGFLVFR
ncbi:hypothetical protein V6Z11_D06G025700 [Gossypium hirsutum]